MSDSPSAIVTGAASGIGRASALAMARRGIRVAVADINEAAGADTVAAIQAVGGEAFFIATDVSREADCARLVAATLEHFGRLDIAFNNAGSIGYPCLTADYGAEAWHHVLDVNLHGVFYCMTHELNAMKDAGGAILNTASIMGLVGTAGGSAYCASKHGVIGLTRAAALEYGRHGVRINAICPGHVSTDMTVGEASPFTAGKLEADLKKTALRRLATPEEIAELVLWLCSDAAAYVTGAAYTIDGGYTAA